MHGGDSRWLLIKVENPQAQNPRTLPQTQVIARPWDKLPAFYLLNMNVTGRMQSPDPIVIARPWDKLPAFYLFNINVREVGSVGPAPV